MFLTVIPLRMSSLLLLWGCCAMLLCGCGGSSPTAPPVAALSTEALAGNWLLYGAIPGFGTIPTSPPGIAVSFDVMGNTIVGSASGQAACNSGATLGFTLAPALSGVIAADGSFSVTSSRSSEISPFPVLSIRGTIPTTAGASWTGSYTLTSPGSVSAPGGGCVVDESGPFTASSIADVAGTYTGTATLRSPAFGTTGAPVALSLALQQGALLYNPNPAVASMSSKLGLSGSLQLQGLPCFSTGSSSTSTSNEVEGSRIAISFTMDDGSTLRLLGSIGDAASSTLSIGVIEVSGGACSGLYSLGLQPGLVRR